ncbi:reverse transcriptase family protein [Streptococcus mitis]|uniref:reverse transcriptase family protein n=1 Tax=Streptococcus mitis TaxID=28037 RepID=UPI0021B5F09A|nr:reverse transcriptase family protein [Streptococcus mitis]
MDFKRSILFGVSNKKWLSDLLKIEKYKLTDISNNFVGKSFIREVNGKTRELYDAGLVHKRSLKLIVKYLQRIDVPTYLHGGIPSRSYVTNVEMHCENSFAIIVDISDFFPSTSAQKVFNFFRYDMNQSPDIAKILTDLTTVSKNGKSFLPQGYPTSPILSYFAYYNMYEALLRYAQTNGFHFSAYYDDLTFSSKKPIPKRCMNRIIKIIESYKLKINKSKSKICSTNNVKVTGCIIVNGELKAPRKLQKDTYDLYMIIKNDVLSENDLSRLLKKFIGKISAIQMIEKDRKFPNYMKLISDKKAELEEIRVEKTKS